LPLFARITLPIHSFYYVSSAVCLVALLDRLLVHINKVMKKSIYDRPPLYTLSLADVFIPIVTTRLFLLFIKYFCRYDVGADWWQSVVRSIRLDTTSGSAGGWLLPVLLYTLVIISTL
jgi:hypothetical protein